MSADQSDDDSTKKPSLQRVTQLAQLTEQKPAQLGQWVEQPPVQVGQGLQAAQQLNPWTD